MVAVVLVILAKLVVISKLGLRNISKKIKNSYIFKHPHSNGTCFDSSNSHCFKIIDEANSKLDLKAKEALHINWKKPNLNVQENHFALTLSLYLLPNLPGPDFFFLYLFFVFCIFLHSLHLLCSISLRKLLESFTVLLTLRYYFISL